MIEVRLLIKPKKPRQRLSKMLDNIEDYIIRKGYVVVKEEVRDV